MTPKQAEKALREVLEPILRPYGFQRIRDLAFVRRHDDRIDRLGFSVFKDRASKLRFSFGVGVRFPEIEALRDGAKDSDDTPTIGVPMHFLRDPRSYFDWVLSDPIDPAKVESHVLEELDARALPFVNEFSSMDALREALERDDARAWFTLDSEQRDGLLTLLDFLQRGKRAAMQRLNAALERRAGAMPKLRYPLEKLRANLEQQPEGRTTRDTG